MVTILEIYALLRELVADGCSEETLYARQPSVGIEPITKLVPRVMSATVQPFELEMYSGTVGREYTVASALKKIQELLVHYPGCDNYQVNLFQMDFGAEPVTTFDADNNVFMTARGCESAKAEETQST